MEKISLFWFRRDLRLEDNTGLYYAFTQEKNVLPLFIFDRDILDKLEDKKDAKISQIENKGALILKLNPHCHIVDYS